ncbi:MAG: hypothetical protein R3342_04345 [Lutibacter sp.]|uniref:hypothetical protein n=1 Tax=Lutibacter sp. TaxID=1925666 RepID=UPI00299E6A78|nr:hypothetical protein [Lutibacter sp.]MDX1828758.1 hypothetical protein [Lutibacter sp.]
MKKIIIFLVVSIMTNVASSQSLNSNASYIKNNYETEYENIIKKHALNEWKDDFSMVVYEINKQADALIELIGAFKSENTNIAYKAIQEWSFDGYQSFNINIFKEMKSFGLKDLVKMQCDWTMVKYEYLKQAKAKNAF